MKTEKPSFKNFINMESKNPLDLAAYAQAELNQQAHLEAAELKSIKVSIYESPLKDYFPDKDMSFHDKVIFAIHKVCELSALQQENEKLSEAINSQIGWMEFNVPPSNSPVYIPWQHRIIFLKQALKLHP